MASRSKYPDPDDLDLPLPDETDPASEYAMGYITQHNRLWAAFVGSVVLNLLLVIVALLLLKKDQPPVAYVTLRGGLPVVATEEGQFTIGGKEFSPARLTGVVKDYLESRFNYDWKNLTRVNDALRYLTAEAAAKERERLTENFLQSKIIVPQVTVKLELDYQNMEVIAITGKPGEFEVIVKGLALYNDLARFPDPASPQKRPTQFKLRVATVESSATNRDGYVITIIPEEIL